MPQDSSSRTSNQPPAPPICRRCGICCKKGGPALHQEDLSLLLEGHITHRHLVTIRQGEPVIPPFTKTPQPAEQELVKLTGNPGWTCRFFNGATGCSIYEHRPLECRTLFCADPAPLMDLVGRGTLTRLDLINPGDPVLAFIERQETMLPLAAVMAHLAALAGAADSKDSLRALNNMQNADIRLRADWLRQGGDRRYELFLFGRPLFLILSGMGLRVGENNGVLSLAPAENGNDRSR